MLAIAAAALFMLMVSPPARAAAAKRPPNIVLILADDLGSADVGIYGSKVIKTPNVDALAGTGVRFTEGYVSHPVCSPSRAGLLTGRYQTRFGWEFNPVGRDANLGLRLGERTIADESEGPRLCHRHGREVAPGWQARVPPDRAAASTSTSACSRAQSISHRARGSRASSTARLNGEPGPTERPTRCCAASRK